MNIFERATRAKLRFATVKGMVMTEDLFDMPLTSRNNFNLDKVARDIAKSLREQGEESFVDTTPNTLTFELNLKLDIVKHVIASKQADVKAAETRAARDSERRKLEGLLADKQDQALKDLTEEELKARIASLNAA